MNKENKRHNHKLIWVIFTLITIPIILISVIVFFRHNYIPTNEEVIEKVKNTNCYSCNVEYIIKNSKNTYDESVKLIYDKNLGIRIEFDNYRVKIYKDGYISVTDNGNEYELEKNTDVVYPLACISNILSNDVESITEGKEEWGDKTYIKLRVNLSFPNKHLSYAYIFIDKEEQIPVLTQIYDVNDEERIKIVYKDFKRLKEVDKSLF